MMRWTVDQVERFWALVERSPGCWLWVASLDKDGYGLFNADHLVRAHRFAFEVTTGIDPGKWLVCHTCDTPPCVRPSHLWLGTNQQNLADMASKGRMAGERNPRAKVTNVQMGEIRERLGAGETVKALANEYDYSRHHLYKMLRGEQWKVSA